MNAAKKLCSLAIIAVTVFLAACAFDLAFAQEAAKVMNPDVTRWAFLAAAISTGLSALAAGIAVAYVGAAAVGAVSEKPEMAGRALIFVGLAEGIAIYGLIIAIMILGKV
ncbi:MAG: ATP synthase subunit C [Candidatus Omnitrophica bacterium]|jgi:V/A-type H+-transporting ATPase subunit K|nr:ATP synthase subunit C [Candidatus Omnitrophota bacterium]